MQTAAAKAALRQMAVDGLHAERQHADRPQTLYFRQ
jgi:hypothetical protein